MLVPADTPVTIPVLGLTVAFAVLLLLQPAPPVVASVSDVLNPAHTVNVPPIAAGLGLTVTTVVL